MKRLLILTLVLSSYGAFAQNYRQMSQFGTDTIRYVQYNFVDRQDQYIGHPFRKVLQDYELCIAELMPIDTEPYAPGANGKSWIYAVSIKYRKDAPPSYRVPFANVTIYFKTPYLPSESLKSLRIEDVDGWKEALKNCIVEKIESVIGPFGPEPKPETRAPERKKKVVKPDFREFEVPFVTKG